MWSESENTETQAESEVGQAQLKLGSGLTLVNMHQINEQAGTAGPSSAQADIGL